MASTVFAAGSPSRSLGSAPFIYEDESSPVANASQYKGDETTRVPPLSAQNIPSKLSKDGGMFRSPLGIRSSVNMLSPQGMSALKMQQGRQSAMKGGAVSSVKAAGPAPEMRPRSPPKHRMQSPEAGPARKASFMDEEKLAAIRAALATPPRSSAQTSPRAEGFAPLAPIAQLAPPLSVAVNATASTSEKFTSFAIETSDTSVQTDADGVSEMASHSSSGADSRRAQEQQQQQEAEAEAQLAAQLQRNESLVSALSTARAQLALAQAELAQAGGSLAESRARCAQLEARTADLQADLDAAGRATERQSGDEDGATAPLSPLRAQLSAALAELDSTRTAVRETLESNAMAATIAQGQHVAAVSGLKRELSGVQAALAEALARAGQREARVRRVAARHGLQAEDFLGEDAAEEDSAGCVEPAKALTGTLQRTLTRTESHGRAGGAGLFSVLRGAAAAGGAGGKGASPKGATARGAAKLPAAAATLRTRTASAVHMTAAPAGPSSSSSLRRTASVPVGVITPAPHTAEHAPTVQAEGAFPAAEKAALKDLCAGLTMQVAALHRALAEAEARAAVAEEVAARARVHAFASAAGAGAGGPTPMKVSAGAGLSDVPFSPLPAYPGGPAALGAGSAISIPSAVGRAAPSAVEAQGHGVASAVVEAVSHAVQAVLAPPPAGSSSGASEGEDGGVAVSSDPATLRQALAAARAHLEHAHAAWREAEERLQSSAQERGQLISVIHALQGEVAAHAAASSALVAEQCALADVVRGATGERDAVSSLNSSLMALLQEAEGKIRSLAIQRQVFRRAVKGVHAKAVQLVEQQGGKGRGGLLARPTTAAAVINSDITAPLAVALHNEAASTGALASGSVPPTPLPMPQPTPMDPSAYGPDTAEVSVGTSPLPPAAMIARDTSPGVEGAWRTSPTTAGSHGALLPSTPYTPGGEGSRGSRVAALAGALLMSPGDAAGVQSAMESMLGGSSGRAGGSSSREAGMGGGSSLREPPSPAGPLDLSGLGAQPLHQLEGGSYTPEVHSTALRLYGTPTDLEEQEEQEQGEEDAGAGLLRVMQEALLGGQGDGQDSLPPVTAEDSMLITGGYTLPALPASPALAQPQAAGASAVATTSVQQSVSDRSTTTLTAVTWSPAGSAPLACHPAEAGASAAALLATAAASSVLASASIAAAQLREAGGTGLGLGLELTLGLGLAAHGPLLAKDAGQEVEQELGAQARAVADVQPMPASAPAPAAVAGIPAHLVLRRRWALAASNAPAISATGLAARRKAARAVITAAGGTVPSPLQSPPGARRAAASPAAPTLALQEATEEELASQACGSSVLTGPDGLPDLTGAAGFWGAHVPAPPSAATAGARPVSAQAAGPAPSMLKKARKGAQMSALHTRGFTEGGRAGHGAHARVQQQTTYVVPSHRGPGAAASTSTAQVPAKTTRYGRSG